MPNATKKYVVAVSGGVDSVVLLDALCRRQQIGDIDPWHGREAGEVIVAHFDHGIRSDSTEDETFVGELARQYGCKFVSERQELGADASEEKARLHRYAFLRRVCAEYDATLVTAHHAGDVAETIAINIERGTGWRGVSVMDNQYIWRPLLGVVKREIREYATTYKIMWREDSTNASDRYLRNRIRKRLTDEDMIMQLLALRARQVELKHDISTELTGLVAMPPYSRYFLTHCGDKVAIELLREIFVREIGQSPARDVRKRVLHEIKVARSGVTAQVSGGVELKFTRTHFIVESSHKMLS